MKDSPLFVDEAIIFVEGTLLKSSERGRDSGFLSQTMFEGNF